MKVTGTWVGEYTYGPEYGEIAGKSVPFTLSLTESWLRDIAGYARDDASRGGQPERGRVTGKRRGSKLEFIKTYPVGYIADESGGQRETQREYFTRQGFELPSELPPHRVLYRGALDESGEAARGEWFILPWAAGDVVSGSGDDYGTWTARRTSYQPSEV